MGIRSVCDAVGVGEGFVDGAGSGDCVAFGDGNGECVRDPTSAPFGIGVSKVTKGKGAMDATGVSMGGGVAVTADGASPFAEHATPIMSVRTGATPFAASATTSPLTFVDFAAAATRKTPDAPMLGSLSVT